MLVVAFSSCRSRAASDAAASDSAGPVATTDTAAAVSAAPLAQPAPGEPVIKIQRFPCYGRCPEYIVELFADGRVRYQGKRSVATLGEKTASIPAGDVTLLLKAFADSGFAKADSAYVEGSTHCGQYHT